MSSRAVSGPPEIARNPPWRSFGIDGVTRQAAGVALVAALVGIFAGLNPILALGAVLGLALVVLMLASVTAGVMVFTFVVTSSPSNPSPRVAALTRRPFLYVSSMARPSSFGSTVCQCALKGSRGIAIVSAGALGNLIDRVRWSRGVVDFIDIGTSSWRFWTV